MDSTFASLSLGGRHPASLDASAELPPRRPELSAYSSLVRT
jgi:hypothetical protein